MTSSYADEVTSPLQAGQFVKDIRSLLIGGNPLIDLRAPVEFAKGAFPGSVNLPLMSDEERHLVGIRYKEQGQESAIALGAQLVSPPLRKQRTAGWKEFVEQNPGCALFCFRGGLRSRIAQQWLRDAGIEIPAVKGGYKALRRFSISTLTELCQKLNLIVIGGRTGIGKTLLLEQLDCTVDLEQLANHRGSSFGSMTGQQPGNIDFENALAIEFLRLEERGARTVYLEDEARLIGKVCVPDSLREAMQRAPIYILESDMDQRVSNCFTDYVTDLLSRYVQLHGEDEGFQAYAEHHRSSLSRIRKRFGGANYKHAAQLLETALHRHLTHNDTSGYHEGIRLLLSQYYDPMYDYQLSGKKERIAFSGTAEQIISKALRH